jgi:hypothetical protein
MKCTGCGTEAPKDAVTCPSCKKGLPAAGLGEDFSYDLAPEDPEEAPEGGPALQAPEGPLPPAGPMPGGRGSDDPDRDPRDKSPLKAKRDGPRGAAAMGKGKGNPLFLMAAGGVLLLIVAYFVLKAPKPEIKGRHTLDVVFSVSQARPKLDLFEVIGSGVVSYRMEVAPADGELLFGVGRRGSRDPATVEALKKFDLKKAKEGATEVLEGELQPGTYTWIVINEGKKPVKAKLKYKVQ